MICRAISAWTTLFDGEPKFPDRRPHGLHRRDANCREWKPQEGVLLLGEPEPGQHKAVAEKVKRDVRILASALSVPAVDDLGLYRMEFEATLCQPRLKSGLEDLGFLLGPTVYQPVVRLNDCAAGLFAQTSRVISFMPDRPEGLLQRPGRFRKSVPG